MAFLLQMLNEVRARQGFSLIQVPSVASSREIRAGGPLCGSAGRGIWANANGFPRKVVDHMRFAFDEDRAVIEQQYQNLRESGEHAEWIGSEAVNLGSAQ